MDEAKRRAIIKQQAAAKKKEAQTGTTGAPKLTLPKRKHGQEGDRHVKKAKVTPETVVGLEAEAKKIPVKHGKGKGLMTGGLGPKVEKAPVLLREDSKYAIEKLSSILTAEDYEDLGNHATEAMGETGLFNLCQAVVMMKGLMDRCVREETALARVRAKAAETEDELNKFKAWRVRMEEKLSLSEHERGELEKQMEVLHKVLEDKEGEILFVKDELRQSKVDAVREYRDSEDYLTELGSTFADGFDDALRQVKALHPDLDLSKVGIDEAQAQTSVLRATSESTGRLFNDDQHAKGDGKGDDEAETAAQVDTQVGDDEIKIIDSPVE